MKIAVLGATGGTGIQIIKQALSANHEIIAIVRNPDNLKEIQNSRLTVKFLIQMFGHFFAIIN
jgi:putative NADH-flavin reductase